MRVHPPLAGGGDARGHVPRTPKINKAAGRLKKRSTRGVACAHNNHTDTNKATMSTTTTEKKFPGGTICCIGAGYVGGPTMAVMAKYCPDVKVLVVDKDQRKIDSWNSPDLPIYEPDLKPIVEAQRNVNLFFSTNVEQSIAEAEIVFLCVNTPNKEYGHTGGYDLFGYESAARAVAAASTTSKVVVEKSTVPVRTGDVIRKILEANKRSPEIHFEILSNPEFLAEGTAIKNLVYPDRVLIGCMQTPEGHAAEEKLASIYKRWIEDSHIARTNLWSSELTKLAANALLAQRISSINALSCLCEQCGADVQEVSRVCGMDPRIGSHFLNSSVGFGGSCFQKDIQGLIYLCEYYYQPEAAEYWRQVLKMNDHQKDRFARNIVKTLFGNVKNKNICVLGFAFKKDTGDFRDSAALDVIAFLLKEQANVFLYDPKVPYEEINKVFPRVHCEKSPYAAAAQSVAIAVLTEWDEFRTYDYAAIYDKMSKPAFLFDGRNLLNHEELRKIGFNVYSIGKPLVQ
eukprot:TRINITY_DN18366_c0_g1_i1.p2 TRINITY_DN18366_c0_g1~~TRINITY_DN18366_c0_g1_i1.p2  ORF type:complete len:514 (+),score=167.02 TRINITY_DN18366_c0_g1_i1:68-1609(+)